jgi:hypothetical protein
VIGVRAALIAGMERMQLNEIPESGTPELLYQIEVLARAFAMLGTASLYEIALWGLTNYLGLTRCFPWSGGPLSNWMIWLVLALTWNFLVANIHLMSTWAGSQKVLLSCLSLFRSLTRQEQQQISRQLALGGE